jgi:glycerol-3-phosphate acyltransferase PlsY
VGVVAIWHYVSAGSMLAALIVPILAAFLAYPLPLVAAASLIAFLVLYKHRSNLQRLRQGNEPKIFG